MPVVSADQVRRLRQRLLLAQLGITVWQARHQSVQPVISSVPLWRESLSGEPSAGHHDDRRNSINQHSNNQNNSDQNNSDQNNRDSQGKNNQSAANITSSSPIAASSTTSEIASITLVGESVARQNLDAINAELAAVQHAEREQEAIAQAGLQAARKLLQGTPATTAAPAIRGTDLPVTSVQTMPAMLADATTINASGVPARLTLVSLLLPGWALVVPLTALDLPLQKHLWDNLKIGLQAQAGPSLDWPVRSQTGRLRSTSERSFRNTMQGYLFGLMQEGRQPGLMGELPDQFVDERWQCLPRLDELLAEPMRKASLYRLLTARQSAVE